METQLRSQLRRLAEVSIIPNNEEREWTTTKRGWMVDLFGVSEREQRRIVYEEGALVTPAGTYWAGWFLQPTVADILSSLEEPNDTDTPVISIIEGRDVGELHLTTGRVSLFQGASQFNALEMCTPKNCPEEGIQNYVDDNTQGPRVALACAPGTFVRNYYYPNFNALDKIPLTIENGYLLWGENPEKINRKLTSSTLTRIKIPVMVYTQVVGVTKVDQTIRAHVTNRLVHQVYSAGVPVQTYGNGGDKAIQLEIAQKIIRAEYIGAIGLGILLNVDQIYLTLIGSGVFNVPLKVVLECLKGALDYFRGYAIRIVIVAHAADTARETSDFFGVASPKTTRPLIPPTKAPKVPKAEMSSPRPETVVSGVTTRASKKVRVPKYYLEGNAEGIFWRLRDYQKKALENFLKGGEPEQNYDFEEGAITFKIIRTPQGVQMVDERGLKRLFVCGTDLEAVPHGKGYKLYTSKGLQILSPTDTTCRL